MIDRPLSRGRLITSQTISNLRAPSSGVTNLVDCMENDGAIVDSVFIQAAGTETGELALYLTTAGNTINISGSNSWPVAFISITTPPTVGQRFNLELPEISTPVPRVGSSAKNKGIVVEKGQILVAAKIGGAWTNGHFLGVQGGFF